MTGITTWTRVLAAVALTVLTLAGCSDDGDSAADQTIDAADETADTLHDMGGSIDDATTGDEDAGESGQDAAGAEDAAVTIEDFAFSVTEVAAGTEVTVANLDAATHTVTGDEDEFDTGDIKGGATKSFTAPAAPGEYAFHCHIHPSMEATLVVVRA